MGEWTTDSIERCPQCGREKISAAIGVIGAPDREVAGSRREYCGFCDTPPVMDLSVLEPYQRYIRWKARCWKITILGMAFSATMGIAMVLFNWLHG